MSTGPDGQHPTTNQFLWAASRRLVLRPHVWTVPRLLVFGPEYGHMIENRMTARASAPPRPHAGRWARRRRLRPRWGLHELHRRSRRLDQVHGGRVRMGTLNGIRDFLEGERGRGNSRRLGRNPTNGHAEYGDFGLTSSTRGSTRPAKIWVAVQIGLRELFWRTRRATVSRLRRKRRLYCVHGQDPRP